MAQDNPRPDRREQLEQIAEALSAMETPRNPPVVWQVRRHLCWRLEPIEQDRRPVGC